MTANSQSRIRALVLRYPGLHLREVARQLDMSLALVQYHVPSLVEAGHVRVESEDGAQRLYPGKDVVTPEELAPLRDGRALQIVLQLLDQGPSRHGEIVAATGLGKSTLSYQLRKLQAKGIVEKSGALFSISRPRHIRNLLETYQPTPDLIDRFARVWSDLYG